MQAEPTATQPSEGAASAAVRAPARAKPAATVELVHPPPGLARGRYEVSGWLVGAAASALLLGVVAFFVLRHRRAQRKRVYESVAPQSGPMSSRR